jgi:hypothetical protein
MLHSCKNMQPLHRISGIKALRIHRQGYLSISRLDVWVPHISQGEEKREVWLKL